MSGYRFHLEKYRYGSKIDCPSCGKKRCFVRYIDETGTVHFPASVGKCDHEQSCGYHYTPRAYFQDNPEAVSDKDRCLAQVFRQSVIHTRPAPVEPSYIPDRIVRATLSHYDINPLFRYLCGEFGEEETMRLFNLYHVGTSTKWGGSTVFWQTDESGKVRTRKVMLYNPATGRRIKEPQALRQLGARGTTASGLQSAAVPVRTTPASVISRQNGLFSREREVSRYRCVLYARCAVARHRRQK